MDPSVILPEISSLNSLQQVLLHLLTFNAGLLIGHRLALGREKRKEFNEAVQPIRTFFLAECDDPSRLRTRFKGSELDLFLQVMPFWKRRGLLKALQRFDEMKKTENTKDEGGSYLPGDIPGIKAAARDVLSYTKRK